MKTRDIEHYILRLAKGELCDIKLSYTEENRLLFVCLLEYIGIVIKTRGRRSKDIISQF